MKSVLIATWHGKGWESMDFHASGGLGGPPSPSAPNGSGVAALSIY